MSPLKTRKMSVAQAEKSFQSSFGAPSSSQMIGIGYGSQMSPTNSHVPDASTSSISCDTTWRMNGRSRSAALGVKAGATRRRSREWASPSRPRIDRCWRAERSSSLTPDIAGSIDSAEWNRRSRRIATTSS